MFLHSYCILHLFAQPVVQVDGQGISTQPATMAEVWEWKPKF
jgi:hypothetical protein